MAGLFASNRLPWSFTPTLCLPMSDDSYDPFGRNTEDLIEETVTGSFGRTTLYCKYDCCGDSKNPECCLEEQTVDPDGIETYKLVSIIAAGAAGLCMLAVALLYIIKSHMKKRRLIRDINSINKMNLKDISKVKDKKYHKNAVGQGHTKFAKNGEKFFKKSKRTPNQFRPSTPTSIGMSLAPKQPLTDVTLTPSNLHLQPVRPPMNTHVPVVRLDTAPPPPAVVPIAQPATLSAMPIVPPPAKYYEDALFNTFRQFNTQPLTSSNTVTTVTGPQLPSLVGAGSVYP